MVRGKDVRSIGARSFGGAWNWTTATWPRRIVAVGGALGILALCLLLRRDTGPSAATAQAPAASAPAAAPVPAAPQPTDVLAIVNGERITRADLARDALDHYGVDVLDSVVSKALIADQCRRLNLVVTREMVDEEIKNVAERFSIDVEEWVKMLEKERNITAEQYANDIIWPTVALRLLAASEIQPTEQDMQQAYETQFGPAVQCRLIACNDLPSAQKIRALAVAAPDEFGNLAKQYSVDVNSASAKGLIQPIRRHLGDANLEQVAFALPKGEISEVIPVHNQFILLKCENHLPARNVPIEQVRRPLEQAIRDKKLRLTSTHIFERLQQQAQVDKVYADPARRAQEPHVAARINGQILSTDALAAECVSRHGKQVLEGMIGRRLLEQSLKKGSVEVTQADIDAEIARAALAMGKTTTPGGDVPDVAGWIKQVTETQQLSVEDYIRDTVWPSAALKKLVAGSVTVSEEDLQKGFEANYGPRIKCRAIVLNQLRRAQEVWQMARDNPTPENFGVLAEQYSIDSVSRTLRGEVPPLQRHGGQPQLEREAFAMQPGELSGIIQVGESYVILLCEGRTEPRQIEFAAVRDLIQADVYEKKLRMAMAREFERMHEMAQIDNFLAGTIKSPSKGQSIGAVADPTERAVPASFNAAPAGK